MIDMTMYRITFNTDDIGPNGFGPWHMDVPEDEVMAKVRAFALLGMTPDVEILST